MSQLGHKGDVSYIANKQHPKKKNNYHTTIDNSLFIKHMIKNNSNTTTSIGGQINTSTHHFI